MMIRNNPFLALIFFTSFGVSSVAPAFYVTDLSGNLGEVNVTSGKVRVIGNTGTVLTDIAFDPAGRLFGLSFSDLYSVDPQTANATLIGPHGISCGNALEFSNNGTLFAAGCGTSLLFTIDTTTGVATALGDIGFASQGDLAFNGASLYLVASNSLVRIDLSNGAAGTPVGLIGSNAVFGLDTDSNGQLLAFSGTDVLSVDTSTGKGTFIFNCGGHGLQGASGATFPNVSVLPAACTPPDPGLIFTDNTRTFGTYEGCCQECCSRPDDAGCRRYTRHCP